MGIFGEGEVLKVLLGRLMNRLCLELLILASLGESLEK